MTNIFKMQLLLALLALAGLTTACGDDGDGMMAGDDDDDDMMMGDDDDDDDMPIMCGATSCMDFPNVGGLITIPGCCADDMTSACGGTVSGGEIPICSVITAISCDAGCIELDQPGDLTPGPDGMPGTEDDECPSITFNVPPSDMSTAPGCCRPDGQCGYLGDFSGDLNGPNFGCVPFDTFEDGVENPCTPAS